MARPPKTITTPVSSDTSDVSTTASSDISIKTELPAELNVKSYDWPTGDIVHILMATNRAVHWGTLKAFSALYERDKMKLDIAPTNFITRGRNLLADKFIAGGAKWALFLDDDVIPAFGDVQFFRELVNNPTYPASFITVNPIQRLINAGKSVVGGVYFGRNPYGVAQFAEAYTSRTANIAAHDGPRDLVQETAWLPMGFTLIQRQVFLDIIASQPEIIVDNPAMAKIVGRWRFFNPADETVDSSEDVAFCARAKKAGHKIYADHAVPLAHVGEVAFSHANTKIRPIVN